MSSLILWFHEILFSNDRHHERKSQPHPSAVVILFFPNVHKPVSVYRGSSNNEWDGFDFQAYTRNTYSLPLICGDMLLDCQVELQVHDVRYHIDRPEAGLLHVHTHMYTQPTDLRVFTGTQLSG